MKKISRRVVIESPFGTRIHVAGGIGAEMRNARGIVGLIRGNKWRPHHQLERTSNAITD